jgi:aspartate aminotransferase
MKLSPRIAAVHPSATISITMRAKELKKNGIDVISLAAGQPDFDTPEHITQATIQALHDGKTKYTPSNGTPELRNAVSEKFARDNSLNYPPDHIVVSCGAKHSLYVICRILLNPDDEVIIPAPYWVSYPEFVTLGGGRSIIVKTHEKNGFRLSPEQLEAAITHRTTAVILNTPSNPTGMGYDKNALDALANVLRKYPHVSIISDEIYEYLTYDSFTHKSFAAVAPDLYHRTFTVSGFSKTFSMTGWRLGYTGCPDNDSADAMKRVQDHSTTGVTSFAQDGAVAALTGSMDCVETMRKAFAERRRFIIRELNTIPGVSCCNPDGAFYAFPNVSAWGFPSMQLALRLLEEAHIALVPGIAFGTEGFLRISYAASPDDLKEALCRLRTWVKQNVDCDS